MVSVATPWVLWAAAIGAAGVIAAHLLSVVTPPRYALPTARFVPDGASRAVSRSAVPTDRWLLLVRVLVLLLVGAALAGLSWTGSRVPVATLLVVEPPAGPGDSLAWRATLREAATRYAPVRGLVLGRRVLAGPDVTVALLDTLVAAPDSLTLAARLLSARRVAGRLAVGTDSVRLVLVSALREDETAAALEAARGTWPGRIDLVELPVGRASDADTVLLDGRATGRGGVAALEVLLGSEPRSAATVGRSASGARVAGEDEETDIVAAAYARWPVQGPDAVRVRRAEADAPLAESDSAFAASGGVLVRWPLRAGDASSAGADTLRYAVAAQGAAFVAPLRRVTVFDRGAWRAGTRPVIWWGSGEVAATQAPFGNGCIRDVAFAAPGGDALLGVSAVPVLRTLAAPCAQFDGTAIVRAAPLDSARRLALAGTGTLASRDALEGGSDAAPSALTRWLLLAALVLLAVESVVRRSVSRSAVAHETASANAQVAAA